MGRHKGTPKTGGRQAGTPNKAGGEVKTLIVGLLSDNADTIRKDFTQLTPSERIKAVAQLAAYVVPKQQAISIEEQAAIEEQALLSFLEKAPDEAIDAIAEKVLAIQARHKLADKCDDADAEADEAAVIQISSRP